MYKKKFALDVGANRHTATAICKVVLTPPHTPNKRGTQVWGGGGGRGQNRKIHWGVVCCPKMMILQGVEHPVSYLGVSYANGPKKGGRYMAYVIALDGTTLFEVILENFEGVSRQPTQQQFWGFRDPWLGVHGPRSHYVGPYGCSSSRIVTKSSPKPIPAVIERFRKKSKFGNRAGVTK